MPLIPEVCINCGTKLNLYGCPKCGAPACCPKCCDEAEKQNPISKMCTCAIHCPLSPYHEKACCHKTTCDCFCHGEEYRRADRQHDEERDRKLLYPED